jgi:hypothetical protein
MIETHEHEAAILPPSAVVMGERPLARTRTRPLSMLRS